MNTTRRQFTIGALMAAAAGTTPMLVQAQSGKTIAVLLDGLYSEFWVAGMQIIKDEMKKRGYNVLEGISDKDDSKQFEQVRAMIARKVDGIIIVQTDSKAVIPAIRAANRANIPMVHFNRPPRSEEHTSELQSRQY